MVEEVITGMVLCATIVFVVHTYSCVAYGVPFVHPTRGASVTSQESLVWSNVQV